MNEISERMYVEVQCVSRSGIEKYKTPGYFVGPLLHTNSSLVHYCQVHPVLSPTVLKFRSIGISFTLSISYSSFYYSY